MRKVKKINGYLIVKFNDRELREWEGSGLGTYGVIDAELYTGYLEIDRSVMEYDDADSLEVAIEQARGLEAELDVNNEPPVFTIVRETDRGVHEDEVNPQLMIAEWEDALKEHVANPRYPEVTPASARQQLYGFKMALHLLRLLDADDLAVEPDTFEPRGLEVFAHLPPEKRGSIAQRVYALGLLLEDNCPDNDCRLYLNTFSMCRELDKQADLLYGWPRQIVEMELNKQYLTLEGMFFTNYAVRERKRLIEADMKGVY